MKSLFITISFIIFALSLTSCSSADKSHLKYKPQISESEYKNLVEKYSRHAQGYDGFYNNFDIHTTMLNSEVESAMLDKERYYFQWAEIDFQKKREKDFQERSSKTKFFLSFFTPDKEQDDLNKGKSLWNIYLDYNGRRYKGSAKKLTKKRALTKDLFPHHSRWSSAYVVSFDIPMSQVEKGQAEFVLTSSLGKSTFKF